MFNITEAIAAKRDFVLDCYMHLHQYPEPSFEEFETTAFIREQLEKIGGYTITTPLKTGLVAEIKAPNPGKTIALRADIDALCMNETGDTPFASKKEGVMHACGHDTHTSMLLGVAAVISEHINELSGTFRLLFQPAEEVPPGGAIEYIAKGVLEGVDYILGQHVMPFLPTGQIGLLPGSMMAASDRFDLIVKGSGGHASQPMNTLDPIAIGAQIINNLQHLVSRELDPLDQLVISVTNFHAGSRAYNIIPDTAELLGSVRTFKEDVRQNVAKRIEDTARTIAQAHRADIDFTYHFGYDPTTNNPEVAGIIKDLIIERYGQEALPDILPLMGAEDFSRYLRVVPGCFFFLGIGNEEKNYTAPLHHGHFRVDPEALPIGMEVMLRGAIKLSTTV